MEKSSSPVPESSGSSLVDQRFPSLDGLRAFSACLVIAAHLTAADMTRIPILWRVDYGNLGVRIFFVISGFLITSLLVREHERNGGISLRDFYVRRAFRILPAYYAFAVVVILLIPTGFVVAQYERLAPPLLFYSDYKQNRGASFMHTWSLSVEEQFYLIWPGLLVLLGLRRSIYAGLALVLIAPIMRGLVDLKVVPFYSEFAFEVVSDALATGCILALLRERLWSVPLYRKLVESRFLLLLPAAALVLIAAQPPPLIKDVFGLPMLNVGITLAIDRYMRFPVSRVGRMLNSKVAQWLGVRSYSIYLWQEVFTLSHIPIVVKLVCTFLSASISYRYVEVPFLVLRSRIAQRRRSRQPAPLASGGIAA